MIFVLKFWLVFNKSGLNPFHWNGSRSATLIQFVSFLQGKTGHLINIRPYIWQNTGYPDKYPKYTYINHTFLTGCSFLVSALLHPAQVLLRAQKTCTNQTQRNVTFSASTLIQSFGSEGRLTGSGSKSQNNQIRI